MTMNAGGGPSAHGTRGRAPARVGRNDEPRRVEREVIERELDRRRTERINVERVHTTAPTTAHPNPTSTRAHHQDPRRAI
jgi:hypothetical protein